MRAGSEQKKPSVSVRMYKCGRQQGTVDLDCTTLANQPPPGVYFLLAAEMEASIARSEAAAESLTLAAGGGPPNQSPKP